MKKMNRAEMMEGMLSGYLEGTNVPEVALHLEAKLVPGEMEERYEADDFVYNHLTNLLVAVDMVSAKGVYPRVRVHVTNAMAKSLGIDPDELLTEAVNKSWEDSRIADVREIVGARGLAGRDDEPIWVVTNAENDHGAICVFAPEVMASLAGLLGDDKFVVIPSSIHECLVVRYEGSAQVDFLCDALDETNRTQLDPKDYLSDLVFVFQLVPGGVHVRGIRKGNPGA